MTFYWQVMKNTHIFFGFAPTNTAIIKMQVTRVSPLAARPARQLLIAAFAVRFTVVQSP